MPVASCRPCGAHAHVAFWRAAEGPNVGALTRCQRVVGGDILGPQDGALPGDIMRQHDTVRRFVDAGYETLAVEDGQAALDPIDTHGQPCVLILDLRMPGMNGWDLRDKMLEGSGVDRSAYHRDFRNPKWTRGSRVTWCNFFSRQAVVVARAPPKRRRPPAQEPAGRAPGPDAPATATPVVRRR